MLPADVLTDSVSSTDGIHAQRPLEQRTGTRGAAVRGWGRNDTGRGRGRMHGPPLNNRTKPAPQPASAVSPMLNDVTAPSSSATKPAAVGTGKEAGDSVRPASEKTSTPNPAKSSAEPSVNSAEAAVADGTPNASATAPVGD